MAKDKREIPQNWTFSLLDSPPRRKRAQALGFWDGRVFGIGEGQGRAVPFVWDAGGPVEVAASGFKDVTLGRGGTAAGQAAGAGYVRGNQHALLVRRKSERFEAVDLHPKGFETSCAMGCSNGQQVGYGAPRGAHRDVALLWHGSADSVIELRAPDRQLETTAYAIADGVQVGYCGGPGRQRALLWRGSTDSVVDLHPNKAMISQCEGTDGTEQVGVAAANAFLAMPSLWHGSAESWVNLTPKGFPGGAAYACAHGFQVGCGALDKENLRHHAVLWAGSAASFLDLHAFVPKQDFSDSCAWGLRVEGERLCIVGEVSLMKDGVSYSQRAAMWEATLSA